MKIATFLESLLSKAEVNNQELQSKLSALEFDVPDELQSAVDGLVSVNAAKSKADFAQHHINKHNHNVNQAHTAKLQALGLSDSEITDVMATSIEERVTKVANIIASKESAKYSGSKDEQVLALEKQISELKNRADSFQKASLNKDSEYSKKLEAQKAEIMLQRIVEGFSLRKDTIPHETALPLIISTVNNSLAHKGAKIIFIGDKPKVVNADDETLDFYDEKSNPIDARVFIERTIQGLNLLSKAPVSQTAPKQTFDAKGNKASASEVFQQRVKALYS